MKSFFQLISCLYLLLVLGSSYELTDETFEKLTQASTGSTAGIHFVMFFVPWCPICQKLKPIFEDVSKFLETDKEENVLGVVLDTIEVESNLRTKARFEVEKYPTFLVFKQGKFTQYEGFKTKRELLEFVQSGILDILPSKWETVPKESSWIEDQLTFIVEDTVLVISEHSYGALVLFVTGAMLSAMLCFQYLKSKSYNTKNKVS